MEQNVVRFVKPVALAIICFVAILYLTKSLGTAMVLSLIPLLLGWLGIMESFAYALAAISFLAAVAWAVTPVGVKTIIAEKADEATLEIKQQMKTP